VSKSFRVAFRFDDACEFSELSPKRGIINRQRTLAGIYHRDEASSRLPTVHKPTWILHLSDTVSGYRRRRVTRVAQNCRQSNDGGHNDIND
jgi:hypothetical protein